MGNRTVPLGQDRYTWGIWVVGRWHGGTVERAPGGPLKTALALEYKYRVGPTCLVDLGTDNDDRLKSKRIPSAAVAVRSASISLPGIHVLALVGALSPPPQCLPLSVVR